MKLISRKFSFSERIVVVLGTVLLLFNLGGCQAGPAGKQSDSNNESSGGEIPAWVTSPNDSYPQDQYIVGVGEGISLSEAKSQAKGQLSTVFRQEIEYDQEVEEEFVETMSPSGEGSAQQEVRMTTGTKVRSQQELLGVEIGETACVDAEYGEKCYALAYVDRARARKIYRQEIEALDEEVSQLYQTQQNLGDPIERLRYLGTAELTAKRAEQLISQYRVLHPAGRTNLSVSPGVDELRTARRELMNTIPIYVEDPRVQGPLTESNAAQTVGHSLDGLFQDLGFTTVPSSSEASHQLTVNVYSELPGYDRDDNIKFVKWRLEITLTELDTGNQMLSVGENDESGGATISQARNRALEKIRSIIKNQLRQSIESRFLRLQ